MRHSKHHRLAVPKFGTPIQDMVALHLRNEPRWLARSVSAEALMQACSDGRPHIRCTSLCHCDFSTRLTTKQQDIGHTVVLLQYESLSACSLCDYLSLLQDPRTLRAKASLLSKRKGSGWKTTLSMRCYSSQLFSAVRTTSVHITSPRSLLSAGVAEEKSPLTSSSHSLQRQRDFAAQFRLPSDHPSVL